MKLEIVRYLGNKKEFNVHTKTKDILKSRFIGRIIPDKKTNKYFFKVFKDHKLFADELQQIIDCVKDFNQGFLFCNCCGFRFCPMGLEDKLIKSGLCIKCFHKKELKSK